MRNNRFYLVLILSILYTYGWAYINPTLKGQKPKNSNQVASSRADCRPGKNEIDMDINNIRARLRTGGDVWWDGQVGLYIAPKPAEGQIAVSSIFAGGVWVGGTDKDGNLKVAGVTYRDQNDDYDWYPGPLNLEGQTEEGICSDWDKFFTVNGDDVRNHIAAFDKCIADSCDFSCDSIPESVLYWPGQGNPFWRNKYEFDLPVNQSIGAFWDENIDGIYNPCDGDFPTIEIRDCGPENRAKAKELVPDQMIFWLYNDNGGPHRLTSGDKIQMEVQVQSFAYATNDEINDMTFYRYKLINKANADIIDCYFAMWVDPDLGCYADDYVGCDVERSLAYTYNEDALDGNNGINCSSSVPTYKENIPMVGTDYFRGPRGPKKFLRDNNGNIIRTPVFDPDSNKVVLKPILIDPPVGSGDLDTLVELGMTSFMYMNLAGVGNPEPATTDPQGSDEPFYNNLRGLWRTGEAVTRGGSGYNLGSVDTVKYVFPDLPDDPSGWSMCTAGLGFGDRRTLQATGPLLLQPGAINELIIGAVWVPSVDHPCPDISKIQNADDIAQALFDNCFDITDGPDAPDIYCVELDKQLILALSNDEIISNNKFLSYKERDLRTDNDTVNYVFEGYKVFQLENPSVSAQELSDVSKARVILQTDLKNNITEIFNWSAERNPFDENKLLWKATRMIAGNDNGLQSTISVLEDQFAKSDRRLINHKQYHFMVIAYAYNNYLNFDPETVLGQRTAYLEGRGNVSRYTFVPRPIVYDKLNSVYGEGVTITRISGQGAGNNFLDVSKDTRVAMANGTLDNKKITYLDGAGPLAIKIFNPLEVTNGKYKLEISGTFTGSSASCSLSKDASYTITDLDADQVIGSATSLSNLNEQIIAKRGFSVFVGQTAEPGQEKEKGQNNGAIGQVLSYNDNSGSLWFNSVLNGDNGLVPVLGPERAETFDIISNNSTLDPQNVYSNLGTGNFFPFALARFEPTAADRPFLTPTSKEAHSIALALPSEFLKMADLNNVDIVFTSDKNLWSRCIVVETASSSYTEGNTFTTIDGCKTMETRTSPSVGKDGKPDGSGNGFSYFPGYAVDLETGERLNIFFGENTVYRGANLEYLDLLPTDKADYCTDMIFNPSSRLYGNGLTNPQSMVEEALTQVAGGQHNIYVTRQKYDGCAQLANILKKGTNSFSKRNGLGAITWTCMPLATNTFPMTSIENGLIPNELTVKLRVNSAYNKERIISDLTKISNCIVKDEFPVYEFEIIGKQADELVKEEYAGALANVNIVPNPYYAYSGYETSQFTNIVKITNLPEKADITIFSLDGKFIRKFKREERPLSNKGNNPSNKTAQVYPDLEWDMKNFQNIPVASGVYLINIVAPELGEERTIKWFGINRKFDPTGL